MPVNPNAGALVFGKAITGADVAIGATAPVAATGTLTLSGNAVAGETVTIGNQTATWVAAITSANNQTPNLVLIGATASDSCDNLIAWNNATASSQGTLYSYNGIPNPFVTAAAGAGDTVVLTARIAGADANLVPTTETMSAGAWGATTLTGGVAAKLSVDATISATAESTAEATAAAPSYTEGQDAPLSQNLTGDLRTISKPTTGTKHFFAKVAGETETIPVGAFDGGVLFLTGTGTIAGTDWPVGVPWNFTTALAATVAVVCANPGTARVVYFT